MAASGMSCIVNTYIAIQLHHIVTTESMYDCKCIANQAAAMETPTPKKRSLGLPHYFMRVKKQKSEEQVTMDEESQRHEGLQDVKLEDEIIKVKAEKNDKEGEKDDDHTTPMRKYTRDDYVQWGKKGGRPSSGKKHTPASLRSLFIKKASQEELEEHAAVN